VAQLNNGHTFFWGAWFDKNNRQSWASALQLWRCILIPRNARHPIVSEPKIDASVKTLWKPSHS
jgi:hypothetical protein